MKENRFDIFVECLGVEAANKIIAALGGQRICVPKVWTENSPFSVLGEDIAASFIRTFAGEKFEVSRNAISGHRRTRLIKKLLNEGKNINAVAAHVGCTAR